jgi:hypothetical protein
MSADSLRATIEGMATAVRTLVVLIEAGDLTASSSTLHRLEGAAVALEVVRDDGRPALDSIVCAAPPIEAVADDLLADLGLSTDTYKGPR